VLDLVGFPVLDGWSPGKRAARLRIVPVVDGRPCRSSAG
jgi:hypothetical protein